nr:hypothetical protein [Brucella anthropi]
MRMVPLDDVVTKVRQQVPAAPIPLAEQHIIEKAIELCERFPAWRDNDQMTFGQNQPDEYICTINGAALVRIETAYFDDNVLEKVPPQYLDSRYPNWDNEPSGENAPRYVTQLDSDVVRIYPVQSGTMRMRLVLKPDSEASLLPDTIVRQFGINLAKGAAGQILLLPTVEYQNPQLGAALLAQFTSWLDAQAIRAQKTQMRVPIRSKPRYL